MENTKEELERLKDRVDEIYVDLGIFGDFPIPNELNTGTIFGKETWGFYPSLTGKEKSTTFRTSLKAWT